MDQYANYFTPITVWLQLVATTGTSDLKAVKPPQKSFVATRKRGSGTEAKHMDKVLITKVKVKTGVNWKPKKSQQ